MDAMGAGNTTERPEERLKPGPPRTYLSSEQRVRFLGLLSDGFGINMAVAEMGIQYHLYDITRTDDPEFAAAVKHARDHLNEKHVAILNGLSLGGNADVGKYLVSRYDHGRRFEIGRRDEERRRNEDLAIAERRHQEKMALERELAKATKGAPDQVRNRTSKTKQAKERSERRKRDDRDRA